jgi:hypothetical protein
MHTVRLGLLLLAFSVSSWAQGVGFIQVIGNSSDNNTGSTTFTVTPSANTSTNNFLIAVVSNEEAVVASMSDSAGNTWTRVATQAPTGPAGQAHFWCKLTTALTTSSTITITKSAPGDRPSLYKIFEVSNLDTAPFDVSTTATGTGTTMAVGPTATTAQADEIAVASWAMDNDFTFTLDASYTIVGSKITAVSGGSGNHVLYVGYRILSATGAQSATSTHAAGSGFSTMILSTFKAAAGGGGGGTIPKRGQVF